MAVNTFDDGSTQRIVDTVKRSESAIINTPSYRRRNRARGGKNGGTQYTFLSKIKSYDQGTGVYLVDLYNNGYGEVPTQTDVEATPTIQTFTPLGIGEKAVVMIDTIETLGDNEN